MGKSLHIFKSGNDIVASNLNYNFRFLLDFLSAIAADSTLIAQLSRSTELADLIADALANDASLMDQVISSLNASSTFFDNLMSEINDSSEFFDLLIDNMISDDDFIDTLVNALADSTNDFDDNVVDLLAQDTRGVNTRTDVGGFSASDGGEIEYFASDSGTIRTLKSDEDSVDADDYATNSTYEVEGSYWKVVVESDGQTFNVWRYDNENVFNLYGYTRPDLHKAGPEGTVGSLYTTEQFLDESTALLKPNGTDRDKTTGRVYGYGHSNWSTLSSLPSGIISIYTLSFKISSASANETFTFNTFNTNKSDNGFVTNVAHAMQANDTLVYEIGRRVLENPSFATELSQNIQKVRINIETDFMGDGDFSGAYTDLVTNTLTQSGTVIDDNTARFELQPRLMDDGSGNFDIVNDPWIIGQVRVVPYIDTSVGAYPIVATGIDPSGGVFVSASGDFSVGAGNAVTTSDPHANTAAYIRSIDTYGTSSNFYLTNDNYTLPTIGQWAYLGWSEPSGSYSFRIIDTIDNDPNYDIRIYRKGTYDELSYRSLANQYILDDLRGFWYYADEQGKLFLEIENNYGDGLGNPNKYFVDIYGYRLIDRDIVFTPGSSDHDHVINEDLTDQVDGSTSYFNTDFIFQSESTRVFNQGIVLRLGTSGDPNSGDYYENDDYQSIGTFENVPSDEYLNISYIRQP